MSIFDGLKAVVERKAKVQDLKDFDKNAVPKPQGKGPSGRISGIEAMAFNRHERRRLAKINKMDRIPGTTAPVVKPKKQSTAHSLDF